MLQWQVSHNIRADSVPAWIETSNQQMTRSLWTKAPPGTTFLHAATMDSSKQLSSSTNILLLRREDQHQDRTEASQDTQLTTSSTRLWPRWCRIRIGSSSHLSTSSPDPTDLPILLTRHLKLTIHCQCSTLIASEHQAKLAQMSSMRTDSLQWCMKHQWSRLQHSQHKWELHSLSAAWNNIQTSVVSNLL